MHKIVRKPYLTQHATYFTLRALRQQRRPLPRSVPQTRWTISPARKSWNNPLTWLIGANVAVWGVYQQANYHVTSIQRDVRLRRWLHRHFDADLENVKAGRLHCLLTHSVAHQAFGHLVFNMLSLHVFGSMLVERIGYRNLYKVYGGAAVASGLAHIGLQYYYKKRAEKKRAAQSYTSWQYSRFQPFGQTSHLIPGAIGASGAIMGIGAMTALKMPKVPVHLYGIVPVPVWAVVTAFAAYDLFYVATDRQARSTTGHMAHLGGGAFGVLAHFILKI